MTPVGRRGGTPGVSLSFRAGWSRYALIAAATVLVLVPFAWMVSIAFTPADRAFGSVGLIPQNPTLANFQAALTQVGLVRALGNSLLVALAAVVVNCLVAPLAGYAFARLPFTGSRILFVVIIATTAIPVSVTLIPLFLMTKSFPLAGGNDILGHGGNGLLDTLPAVTIPHLVGAMNVFLARQYFLGMPPELAEAARVDGASELRIFTRIHLPLARPLIAIVAIFSFTGTWDDFLWPLVTTSSSKNYTVQLALVQFNSTGNVQYGALMAGAILITLPVLVVFLFNQRSFIAGLAEGGSKG